MSRSTFYAVVQHSGYVCGHKGEFEQGLESLPVNAGQKNKVEKLGGVVFDDYRAAEDFCDTEMYGPAALGLIPRADGTFIDVPFSDLPIYIPSATKRQVADLLAISADLTSQES